MSTSIELKAKLACLYAGAVWGLFWIPLGTVEKAGIDALWITVVYFLIPQFVSFPLYYCDFPMSKMASFHCSAPVFIGWALLLYSISIVYTEVVRAVLLFYLTLIWATFLAKILGEMITRSHLIAMVLAITGMITVFGLDVRFSIPRNVGDWLGVTAGFFWAVAIVRIR